MVGTSILLFCVRAITDEQNMKVPTHFVPIAVGFVVLNIGICFGYNCGYAINPARDFAPRVFTSMLGYGSDVFRYCIKKFCVTILLQGGGQPSMKLTGHFLF